MGAIVLSIRTFGSKFLSQKFMEAGWPTFAPPLRHHERGCPILALFARLTPDLRPGLMHGAQKNTVCFETLMRGKDEMSGASPIVLNTKEMLLEILDRGEHLNMV